MGEHKKKEKKIYIPSKKDVVNLCHRVNTEVHSPRCLDTKWQGPLCCSALYGFRSRLSSPVSWELFDRSLSNLDTSITRPFSFEKKKKSKKVKKIEKFVSSLWEGGEHEKMGYQLNPTLP